MPSFKTAAIAALVATASALPALPNFTPRQLRYAELSRRQNEAAIALGLGDLDVLQL